MCIMNYIIYFGTEKYRTRTCGKGGYDSSRPQHCTHSCPLLPSISSWENSGGMALSPPFAFITFQATPTTHCSLLSTLLTPTHAHSLLLQPSGCQTFFFQFKANGTIISIYMYIYFDN